MRQAVPPQYFLPREARRVPADNSM